MKTKIHIGF